MKSNQDFQRMITKVRKWMPYIAVSVLVFVYAVSAGAAGLFLANLMSHLSYGFTLGISIGVAIQITRGTIVFFRQLNPSRPSYSYSGEMVAIAMGVISIFEIYKLSSAMDLPMPVAISLSILMIMGILVEVYLLGEMKFSTGIELMGDKQALNKLYDYYNSNAQMKAYLDSLSDIETRGEFNSNSTPPLTQPSTTNESTMPYSYQNEAGEQVPIPEEILSSLGISRQKEQAPELILNGSSKNGHGAHA